MSEKAAGKANKSRNLAKSSPLLYKMVATRTFVPQIGVAGHPRGTTRGAPPLFVNYGCRKKQLAKFLRSRGADAILRKSPEGSRDRVGRARQGSIKSLPSSKRFDRLTNGRSEVPKWQESEAGWNHQSLPETLNHEVDVFGSR